MSGLGWQDAVVALIVLCALGYLVWRKVRARKDAATCGDCEECSVPAPQLVRNDGRTSELPIMEITADKRG